MQITAFKAILARRINIQGSKDYENTFARMESDCTLRFGFKVLSLKVHTTIQPVFLSRKIERDLNVKETKPPIVNQQCVVYSFQCDLCDAGYVGYTRGHLHNRVKGHKTILRHCQTLQERARDDASGLAKAFQST